MKSGLPPAGPRHTAFDALYQRYNREVWALAYARWMDADMALDIVQEAFLRLWSNAAGEKPEHADHHGNTHSHCPSASGQSRWPRGLGYRQVFANYNRCGRKHRQARPKIAAQQRSHLIIGRLERIACHDSI